MSRTLLRALFSISLTVVMMTGCVIAIGADHTSEDRTSWQQRQTESRDAVADLELGLRRSSVEDRLGAPDAVESFTRDGKEFVVLIYRTHETGGAASDETTPVVLLAGNVVGWGGSAIEYATAGG